MSTKCSFRVDVVSNNPGAKKRPCGKEQKIFLRFEYSKLHHYREREGRFFDCYGFCSEHGEFVLDNQDLLCSTGAANADIYNHRIINGLRGDVKSVLVIDSSEIGDPIQHARNESRLRRMASVKGDIKRIMSQRNTASLSTTGAKFSSRLSTSSSSKRLWGREPRLESNG